MQRLLRAIAAQPWAMSHEYVDAMLGIIETRLQHGKLEPEEIEARINGRKERKVAETDGGIAVIPVRGVISNRASMIEDVSPGAGTSAERLERDMRTAYESREVKAIVLDVDSPGGSAAGTPEVASVIRSMRGGDKPIIAQVGGLAASAAYWIASAADEIVATPSSDIGSIGVIRVHKNIQQMLEAEGVEPTIISAGKYKAEGNPFEPLDDEAREAIQSKVDQFMNMFVGAVAEGRGVDKDTVRTEFGQGRTMLAEDAKRAGMIDTIGSMRETLERFGGRPEGGRNRQRAGNARAVALERKRLNLEQAAR